MAVYGDDLFGEVWVVGKDGKAVDISKNPKEGYATIADNMAKVADPKVTPDPEHENVTHVHPGDPKLAEDLRGIAAELRSQDLEPEA